MKPHDLNYSVLTLKNIMEDVFKKINSEGWNGFAIQDTLRFIKRFKLDVNLIYVGSFIVEENKRGKGYGTHVLKEFCEEHKDSIILTVTGIHGDVYKEELDDFETFTILRQLDHFYEKVGFINVNEWIGCFNDKNSFIYNNEPGKRLINLLKDTNIHAPFIETEWSDAEVSDQIKFEIYHCNYCEGMVQEHYNFCPNCGIQLDWEHKDK